jgi:YD repeat-containing protein
LGIVAVLFASLVATSATAGVTYAYDTLGRLSTATYDNGKQIAYTYDPAGNRTLVVTQATPHLAAVQHVTAKVKKPKRKRIPLLGNAH